MADEEEDEWEYEYDENQTENFYITVDLSNIPERGDLQVPEGVVRPSLSGHPILLQSRLRAINAVRRHEETVAESVSTNDASSSMGAMQITGLHTSNPLIMYGGQLLSCHWGSTIGTDMFFVKPSSDTGTADTPLRSLPSVDLLAISSAKLTANVARLRPRDDVIENVTLPENQALSQGTTTPRSPTEPDKSSPPRLVANTFLEKLNQIKAKRGESSRLMVSQSADGVRLVGSKRSVSAHGEDVHMTGTEEG
jgi:hypothetical protein